MRTCLTIGCFVHSAPAWRPLHFFLFACLAGGLVIPSFALDSILENTYIISDSGTK